MRNEKKYKKKEKRRGKLWEKGETVKGEEKRMRKEPSVKRVSGRKVRWREK